MKIDVSNRVAWLATFCVALIRTPDISAAAQIANAAVDALKLVKS